MLLRKSLPRVLQRLLEPKRNAALGGVDLEHLNLDLLAGRDDLAGVDVLLGPRHLGDVDEALDAGLELDEGAVVRDVGDAALELLADGVARLNVRPRIFLQLLHAERDAVGLVVDLDDAHLDLLADGQDFARMVDAPPGDVGHMQEAVDAAEVDERAVIGEVLDRALDDLPLGEVGDDLVALLGPALLENGAAGDDDIAAPSIHLEDLERLGDVHQRADVTHRANVDLAARQEGDRPVEVDREAALDLVEDHPFDLLVLLERLLELDPALLAPRLVARDDRFAERVLDPLEIDFDFVAKAGRRVASMIGEFLERHAPFSLKADVDDGHVLLDRDDLALDDRSLERLVVAVGLVQ